MFRQENPPEISNHQDQIEKVRALVKEGGIDTVVSKLQEEGLLETMISETKKKYTKEGSENYERNLATSEFLTDQDWKLISLMDFFDSETAEHEIRVFNIAHDHLSKSAFVPVSKKTVDGKIYEKGYSVSLEEIFEHEGVLKEHFLRAALHHDIGKIDVPTIVLMNKTTDKEWLDIISNTIREGDSSLSEKLSQELGVDVKELFLASISVEKFEEEITAIMKEKGCRAKDIVPIRYSLSQEGVAELEKKGFSLDRTLADIIQVHEERSGDILRNEGFDVEAELAENHHNYNYHNLQKEKEVNKPISIGALVLSVCLTDILHIADVEQAMQAKRAYKSALGPFETWSSICDLAEQGKVSKEVAYLWLKSEIDEMGVENYQKNKEEYQEEQARVEHFLQSEEDVVWGILEAFGLGLETEAREKSF